MTKPWDQSVKDRVCKMWLDGMSANQISHAMKADGHNMTRSAVLGVVHRAHPTEERAYTPLTGPYSRKRQSAPITIPAPEPASAPVQAPMIVAKLPAAVEEMMLVGPVTMENVSNLTCRYPIGDVGSADFHFCGKPPKPNSPYCSDCHKICHQPMQHGVTISAEDRKLIAAMNRKSGSQRAFG